MQLYMSETSPYARMVRVVVREKGLEGRVEELPALTRQAGSPFYGVNPSGRVPALMREGEPVLEGSTLICDYLDHLDGAPVLRGREGVEHWEALRLEEQAKSLMDGLAVWLREVKRPESDRSADAIAHEIARADRLLALWQGGLDSPALTGSLNMIQITLACALLLEQRVGAFQWRGAYPGLAAWLDPIAARPSFAATTSPANLKL